MFCQNCGAELRLESGFCAVCGVGIPGPTPHLEGDDHARQGRAAQPSGKPGASNGATPRTTAPQGDPGAARSAAPANPPAPPSYRAIRYAAQRGARSLAPVASLEVPGTLSAPTQASGAPAQPVGVQSAPAASALLVAPMQPVAAPGQPWILPAAPLAGMTAQPASALGQPWTLPMAPATGMATQPVSAPAQVWMAAPALAAPPYHNGAHPQHNGYHPIGWAASATSPAAGSSGSMQVAGAPAGIRLPTDAPNRLALGALICMFASFFLPWVIIGNSRSTPLTIGWPAIVPLAMIAAAGLTILLPERTLYTRFFLALPLVLGCFALGSALLIFLLSSAIAANTVGVGFLGVDVGFGFFALGAFVLACAGYYKLVRELPLLLAGHLRLAPLPGALRGLSEPMPSYPAYPPAAQYPSPNGASQNGAASVNGAEEGE